MAFLPITGTFVDGIACDIPSNNWSEEIWRREFRRYQADGVQDVCIIRVGFRDSAMYKSDVMKNTLCPHIDMVKMMLDLASECGLRIYMGLHDSCNFWFYNDWDSEVSLNRDLIHELNERYGSHPAFYGWYMSHEGDMHYHQTKIWKPLCQEIRKFDRARPIFVSPRYAGKKWEHETPILPQVHKEHMRVILEEMEGLINIYAPMDGHVPFNELEGYLAVTKAITQEFGAQFWTNLETFDRDMPWHYPPIEFAKLKYKLEVCQKYVSKVISFELPHFLSPDSMFPSAHRLYELYHEYLKTKNTAVP